MSTLDRRLKNLEESSAGRESSLDQSRNLTPGERAIVLRNYVRWIARLSLTNGGTLQRFFDVYGPDEPSPVDLTFEGMNPNYADNLTPFGLGPDDIWPECAQSGLSSAAWEEDYPQRDRVYRSCIIGPNGTVPEPDYKENFSSYESRH